MAPSSKESEASGVDHPGRALVRDRTVAELLQLHADVEALAHDVSMWSGVGARRRLRDAKNAEADLLRVLGFSTYGEFVAFVGPTVAPPIERAVAPAVDHELNRTRELERALGAAHAEIEELRTKIARGASAAPEVAAAELAAPEPVAPEPELVVAAVTESAESEAVGSLRADVERAAAELVELRDATREVREMIVEVGAELVAARLEILVAAKRMRVAQEGADSK